MAMRRRGRAVGVLGSFREVLGLDAAPRNHGCGFERGVRGGCAGVVELWAFLGSFREMLGLDRVHSSSPKTLNWG